jgi:hypothetical protein
VRRSPLRAGERALLVLTASLMTTIAAAAPAGPGAAFGGKLPFPAPRIVQVTEATKCDFGTVLSVDAAGGRMRGTTRAGTVTYLVGPDVQVIASDGTRMAGLGTVTVGARYRAYYVVDQGARLQELDLVE